MLGCTGRIVSTTIRTFNCSTFPIWAVRLLSSSRVPLLFLHCTTPLRQLSVPHSPSWTLHTHATMNYYLLSVLFASRIAVEAPAYFCRATISNCNRCLCRAASATSDSDYQSPSYAVNVCALAEDYRQCQVIRIESNQGVQYSYVSVQRAQTPLHSDLMYSGPFHSGPSHSGCRLAQRDQGTVCTPNEVGPIIGFNRKWSSEA